MSVQHNVSAGDGGSAQSHGCRETRRKSSDALDGEKCCSGDCCHLTHTAADHLLGEKAIEVTKVIDESPRAAFATRGRECTMYVRVVRTYQP